MSGIFLTLPLVFAFNQLDYTDENVLLMARVAYYSSSLLVAGAYYLIKQRVAAANNTKKIYVPPAANPLAGLLGGGGDAPKLKETTYLTHELELAGQGMQQALMGMLMMSFFSFKMGMHMPLLLQAVLTPVNLVQSPLFKMYILGWTVEKPWKEEFTPNGAAVTNGTAPAGAAAGGNNKKAVAAAADAAADPQADFERYIVETWEENKVVDPATVNQFISKGADINMQTRRDQWTVLMVAAAHLNTNKRVLKALMDNGANPCLADGDGWMPLYWASRHGSLPGVKALLELATPAQRRTMLTAKTSEGETALEVASKKENVTTHAAIATVLQSAIDQLGDAPQDAPAAPAAAAAPAPAAGNTKRRANAKPAAAASTKAIEEVD